MHPGDAPPTAGSIHLLDDIPLELDERVLLRTLRIPAVQTVDALDEPQLRTDIRRAIELGTHLARPRATARWFTLPWADEAGAAAPGASEIAPILLGTKVVQWLEGCRRATLIVVTVGDAIERRTRALAADAITDAFHLDAVGSALAEAAAEAVDRDVANAVRRAGFEPTHRRSPGYGDWPLHVQPLILDVCGAVRIGVRTTPEHVLQPSKSITALIGWRASGG